MDIAVNKSRIQSIDLLRGLVMIIMALDHTRDFFHIEGMTGDPTNLATTTPALFFTRWITHFCAPVFCLLAGVGVRLSLARKTPREVSRFLWTRGLWLIVLDGVVLRCLVFQWNFDYQLTILNVLWMLGWCMIALAALIHLPATALAIFSGALIIGHNLLDSIQASTFGALAPVWTWLHAP